jgi:hypothetical protein
LASSPLVLYKAYGWAWIFGLFANFVYIYASATSTGLRTGAYVVTLYTNTHGENYLELAGFLLAFPAILLIFYDWANALRPKAKT